MYALNVGVRNRFFSLSNFSESPEKVIEKSQDVIEAWCSSYNLDPSWDQGINGQEDSLVWCRDGAKVLTPEHFQDGFFMFLVKESKDAEIKIWKPVRGSTLILCAELRSFGYSHGLRLVRPFKASNPLSKRVLKDCRTTAFGDEHLKEWTKLLVDTDGGFSSSLSAWPESRLLEERHDSTTN